MRLAKGRWRIQTLDIIFLLQPHWPRFPTGRTEDVPVIEHIVILTSTVQNITKLCFQAMDRRQIIYCLRCHRNTARCIPHVTPWPFNYYPLTVSGNQIRF